MLTYVFTSGDINGIGPEISLKTFNKICLEGSNKIIYVCPANAFLSAAKVIKPQFNYEIIYPGEGISKDNELLSVVDIGNYPQRSGLPTPESGKAAYSAIKTALEHIKDKNADAMITAPISKEAFQKAGINFPGHTELLADYAGVSNFAMMFVSEILKAALVTIHKPLKEVSSLISRQTLISKLEVLLESLENDFGSSSPRIAVLGLNPHAGEEGNIGREELEIIIPALRKYEGSNVFGPFVPDAFFANQKYGDYDLVLGMYHDQVLIPFKMLSFNKGVNYTAGLPFVRTSPDHGTAFDIAGKNLADNSSLLEAYKYAEIILTNRQNAK